MRLNHCCLFRAVAVFVLVAGITSLSGVRAEEHDIVIYGGTPAGLAAGIAAAREGASVVVIEPSRWIGGMVTGGLSHTDKGREATIGGIAREFFKRAAAAEPDAPMWFAEPHTNLATFESMLHEAKVTVVKTQRLKSVALQGTRIQSICTEDNTNYLGKMFIDASYEGDLMARAGVRYIVGRESREQYGEPLAGFHPMPIRPHGADVMGSVCSCIGGTGPHYIHGAPVGISARDKAGKLLFGVKEVQAQPGSADHLTQSYNFRLCVTRRSGNRVPFSKPRRYDPSNYDLLLRLIQKYPNIRFGRLVHLGALANGKYDLNAQGLFSTDYAGGNADYPGGNYVTRDRIWRAHLDYVQGFLWFLGHDQRVPKTLRDEVNEWGLCRDEFTDNGHWPYALYIREARRMVGEYVMTQRDTQTDIFKPDSVAMGSFVLDCHIVQRIVAQDGTIIDEGSFQDAPTRPYQIPYRSLVPKRVQCGNLLVPVCLSASHIAYCSLRMEPVYMALGHASGLAAVMAIRHNTAVQDVAISQLQAKLREQKAVLKLKELQNLILASKLPGIVVDDRDAQFTGTWGRSSFGNPIEGVAQHDVNTGKGAKSARFLVHLESSGRYEVRVAYTAAPNRATNVPVTVEHADGSTIVTVNQKQTPEHDKLFTTLGVFRFASNRPAVVTVRNNGTDGFVSVDAVQLLPVE